MRITESVLRGLIRETLLREGLNALGEVPTTPITVSRRDTVILKKLQSLIGAPVTGKYDADTENAWDEYIAANIGYHRINGVSGGMSVEIRTDWASAAGAIEIVDDESKTFTPNIQGMYDFAWLIAPKAVATVAGSTAPAVSGVVKTSAAGIARPYVKEGEPDGFYNNWPAGVTLSAAELWSGFIEDAEIGGSNWKSADQIRTFYTRIKDAITANKDVRLIGMDRSERDSIREDENVYAISVANVPTLDGIWQI